MERVRVGSARRARSKLLRCLAVAALALVPAAVARAGDTGVEAWRTSPFHGLVDAATGSPIPCRCSANGRSYALGERVCLRTPDGFRLSRCDMLLNNTTWVPTADTCVMSWIPRRHQS